MSSNCRLLNKFSTLNQRRILSFLSNKRAKFSLLLFLLIFIVSLFSEFWANDKPLVVFYQGNWYFPIVRQYHDIDFDGDFPTPADYKDAYLIENINKNGWMIMPPVPFSFNTVDYDMNETSPAAPSFRHWLGTDDEGRDILARIFYGLRLSIVFAFLLTFFSSVAGITAGAIQGYFGGKIDIFFQRVIEIWESLPQLFILIIVASVFVPTFWILLFILFFFSWMALTPVVRAEFLRTRNMEYVKAAKVMGAGPFRIIVKHILPNAIIATITFIPFLAAEAIVSLTALDFLGLGLPPEYPSLGDLVRQGKDNLQAPWIGISIFTVLSLVLTLLIFVGEGVRDAFDARKNK